MAAKKRKAAAKSKEPKQTSLSPDGFREPLAIDDVPWRKAGAGSRAFKRSGRRVISITQGASIDVGARRRFSLSLPFRPAPHGSEARDKQRPYMSLKKSVEYHSLL
jgi:hypothetical protein